MSASSEACAWAEAEVYVYQHASEWVAEHHDNTGGPFELKRLVCKGTT